MDALTRRQLAVLAAASARVGLPGTSAWSFLIVDTSEVRERPPTHLGLPGSRRSRKAEARGSARGQTMPSSISACSRAFPYADGVLYERRATNHHTVARTSTATSAIDA